MSFILDALKKSESDRQRQGGPALFEVKVAPPRHALPSWAVAIAVLFLANLAVVGRLLWRHAAAPPPAPPPPPRPPPRTEPPPAAAPEPSPSADDLAPATEPPPAGSLGRVR